MRSLTSSPIPVPPLRSTAAPATTTVTTTVPATGLRAFVGLAAALPVLLLATACAHPGAAPGHPGAAPAHPGAAEAHPGAAAGPEAAHAPPRVTLTIPAADAPHLDLHLVTPCPEGRPPRLTIRENYASLRGLDRFVANVSAKVDGAPAHVRRVALGAWEVQADDCQVLEVTHQVLLGHKDAWKDLRHAPGMGELPFVDHDHAYLFGQMLLLSPDPAPAGPVELALVAPEGWTPAGPWPLRDGVFVVPAFESLRENYFGTGRLVIRTERLGALALTVALQPGEDAEADARFVDAVVQTIRTTHGLFARESGSAYLVFVNRHPDPRSAGGSVRRDSIVLNVSSQLPPEARVRLQHLVAHEFFHTWRCAAHPEDEKALKWLLEGFTDYFAWYVLREAGVLDRAAWAGQMEQVLGRARDLSRKTGGVSLAAAAQRFYQDGDARDLAYAGGTLLAMHLDGRLGAMDDDRSLLGFLRRLYNDWCPAQETWDVEGVLGLAREYGGDAFAGEWAELVHAAPFTRPGPGPGCAWATRKTWRPELGLGWSTANGPHVMQVAAGGAAERAGLQRGDGLLRIGEVRIQGKSDWDRALAAARRGEPLAFELERDGGRLERAVVPDWVEVEEERLVCED